MTKHRITVIRAGLLVAAGLAAACGSSRPPQELQNARTAYQRAEQSQAKQLNPAGLHEARAALNRAERSFKREGDDMETRHEAYVAARKAQLAETEANTIALKRQEEAVRNARAEAQAKAAAEAKGELEMTREQLAAERQAAAARLAEMQARQEASEARFRAEMEELAAAAQVRQESRGTVVTLPGTLMFASGESELRPQAQDKLNQVAEALADEENKQILVEGHTDSSGSDELNQALSRNRAENVRRYLISRGIPEDRITAVGLGEDRPIADNSTPTGRAQNRRVEIVIQDREPQEQPGMQEQPGAEPDMQEMPEPDTEQQPMP